MAAVAVAALNDGFETAGPAWTDAGGEARYRIEMQERTRSGSHSGDGCEFLQIHFTGPGRSAFLRYTLGRAPVINELRASVWLRADRAGPQLMARVVLPRAIDSSTGKPLTTLLAGTVYAEVGRWQQLELSDVATLLNRQAWVLRAQRKSEIDTREAYVDCLLLNVASGPGRLQLWIDDLTVDGVVTADSAALAAVGSERIGAQPVSSGGGASSVARPAVEFNGSVFLVEGRPFFPHMIEHRGEPLRWLADRGFNTVKLAEPPSAELLADAQRTGLWLVCPPPANIAEALQSGARPREISSSYDRVLAWTLGDGLSVGDLESTRRLAELVRRADPYTSRPTLCGVEASLFDYSRKVDVLAIGRDVLGSSFELNDYGVWLRERMRLMRPGTPAWVNVQTEFAPELLKQMELLSAGSVTAANVDVDQLRAMVYTSLAAGARGICFRSSQRLDAEDEFTKLRAAALELLNTELDLLEPWTASGAIVTNITSSNYTPPKPPAPGNGLRIGRDKKQLLNPTPQTNPEVNAFVLQTERARLLLPIWSGAGTQFVASQWAGNNLSFIVPGVSEATDAYEVTASALQPPFRRQRVTGGIRVTLDECGVTDMIVLTQDPL
ncbi:MAG TPA: hypothetical protein VG713_22700, partial [Pirellulales bacterium]|nr:hypothetical protein [Pirellulales bacterium]